MASAQTCYTFLESVTKKESEFYWCQFIIGHWCILQTRTKNVQKSPKLQYFCNYECYQLDILHKHASLQNTLVCKISDPQLGWVVFYRPKAIFTFWSVKQSIFNQIFQNFVFERTLIRCNYGENLKLFARLHQKLQPGQ